MPLLVRERVFASSSARVELDVPDDLVREETELREVGLLITAERLDLLAVVLADLLVTDELDLDVTEADLLRVADERLTAFRFNVLPDV
ncbi:MAG: hypothetical protein CL946_13635 [Ectothiorhodospiraceae bacterium]|nr:hypothetical protein [Ectothiorhodospiraceae bacterium]